MALPTDQKVGGSSPFERANQTGLVGIPARPVVVRGLRDSERSSCIYPWSARLGPFGPNLYPNPDPAVEPPKTPKRPSFQGSLRSVSSLFCRGSAPCPPPRRVWPASSPARTAYSKITPAATRSNPADIGWANVSGSSTRVRRPPPSSRSRRVQDR